jgi:hypothetical protein
MARDFEPGDIIVRRLESGRFKDMEFLWVVQDRPRTSHGAAPIRTTAMGRSNLPTARPHAPATSDDRTRLPRRKALSTLSRSTARVAALPIRSSSLGAKTPNV